MDRDHEAVSKTSSRAGRESDAVAEPTSAKTSDTTDYVLCGWRIRSAVPLPEVMRWTGNDRAPDVVIRLGPAPPLRDASLKGVGPVQVGRDGVCRLEIKDVAACLVIAGREVVVDARTGLDLPDLRGWLLGVALGMLCHQRGLFPLHASCVRIGAAAVALAGRTGTGKSTLAAALALRGHGLLADDVCAIELAPSGGPQVRPSFPRLLLSDDAMRALDLARDSVPRASKGKRKFHFCEPRRFDTSPARLHGVYLLERSAIDETDIQPVSGAAAAAMLSTEIFRPRIGFHLGRKADLLAQAFHVAAQVPVFRCPVHPGLTEIGPLAARVEAHAVSRRGS